LQTPRGGTSFSENWPTTNPSMFWFGRLMPRKFSGLAWRTLLVLPNCACTCWVGRVLSLPTVAASGSWQAW
jgi:hypothetical protein